MQYQPLLKLTTTSQQQQDQQETKPHITLVTDTIISHPNNKLRQPTATGRENMTNLSSTTVISNSPPHHDRYHHHDSTVPSPPSMLDQQQQHHHSVIERVSCKMPRHSTAAGCYVMESMKSNISPDTSSYLGKND